MAGDVTTSANDWHFVTPQLPVSDIRETQAYYRDVLGFKIAWLWQEEFGADAVLADYRERGVKIVEEIASHPYGMREFSIEDNNGHRFRSGHSSGPVAPPTSEDSK